MKKSAPTRFAHLSPPRQVLVRLCQSLNYGDIADLLIKNGEPQFSPLPRVVASIRLDEDSALREGLKLADFDLLSEVRRLMSQFDEIGDAAIERIEVRAGLPRRIVLERKS